MNNKNLSILVSGIIFIQGCTYKQQSDLISMNMKAEESVKRYVEESPIDWNSNFMQLMTYTAIALVLIYIPGTTVKRTRGYIGY